MATYVPSLKEELFYEIASTPVEHLPNLLRIVRAFRESVIVGVERPVLTANVLLDAGIIGMWRNRQDIGDSSEYARTLRAQAQNRNLEQ